jgi:hypothetical protein
MEQKQDDGSSVVWNFVVSFFVSESALFLLLYMFACLLLLHTPGCLLLFHIQIKQRMTTQTPPKKSDARPKQNFAVF